MIRASIVSKNYVLSIVMLSIFSWNFFSIGDSGDSIVVNLTNKTLYVGMYQYNHERRYNTKVSFSTIKPQESAKIFVPDNACIASSSFASCTSQTRRRLFVSTVSNNNVIQYQEGIINSSILQLDPSLWYAKIKPSETYLVFYNGFFFDPWYAIENRSTGKADVASLDREAYLYPDRLNVIKKEGDQLKVVNRYIAFEQWMTRS